MNNQPPLTYLLYVQDIDEQLRRCCWREFACNGAKRIVLDEQMLRMIMQEPGLEKKLAAELAAEGLSFADAHAPYGPYWDLNCTIEEERPALAVRLQLAIAIVASLGVKTMTVHVGTDHLFPDVPFEKHFSRSCSMLEKLLPTAEKYGVTLAIENGWTKTTSTETLLALKEKFPVDNLGFCFDSGHANIMDNGRLYSRGEAYTRWNAIGVETPPWEKIEDRLQRMLPHIVNCHLHDNDGSGDMHILPGQGNINWGSVLNILLKAPRLQIMQSEVLIFRNSLSIRETVETFNKLFKQEC